MLSAAESLRAACYSVLSPTLFTIYTRDAPHSLRGTNIVYADYITIGNRDPSVNMAKREMVREIGNY